MTALETYKRIFVLHPYGIGDLITLLPTLYSLRRNLPDSEITLRASQVKLSLATALEGKLVNYLTVRRHNTRSYRDVVLDNLDCIREIRESEAGVLVELIGGRRYALVEYFVPCRTIHSSAEESHPMVRNWNVERLDPSASPHRVDRYLQLLERLGLPYREICFDMPIPDSQVRHAIRLIAEKELDGRRLIGLVPVSGSKMKDWPSSSLRGTIDVIVNDLGYDVAVLGKDVIHDLSDKRIIDLRGPMPLPAVAYLLRYSGLFDVVAGVDTGLMHIAGSVNSKSGQDNTKGNFTVSLFGATDPERWKPYDPTRNFNLVVHPDILGISRDNFGIATDWRKRDYIGEIDLVKIIEAIERQLQKSVVLTTTGHKLQADMKPITIS